MLFIIKRISYYFTTCLIAFSANVTANDSLSDAIFKNGTPHLVLRYRFEYVDDNALQGSGATLEQADASTLRTFAGYETGSFHGFAAMLAVENVVDIGSDDFNDGSNGKTQFATVVDPSPWLRYGSAWRDSKQIKPEARCGRFLGPCTTSPSVHTR